MNTTASLSEDVLFEDLHDAFREADELLESWNDRLTFASPRLPALYQ